MRLGQGQFRVRIAQRAHPQEAHLGLDVHRWQHGRAQLAGLCAQGRRRRTHDAGQCRRCALEGAGGRMHGRPRRDRSRAEPAHPALRRGGGRGREAGAAEGHRPARSEGLEDRGQAGAPLRHSGQGLGQAGVRCRRGAAGNVACVDRAVPGVRRHAEERRRRRCRKDARREESGAGGRFRRGRRRQLVARRPGAAEAPDRVGCRWQRQRLQRDHNGDAARGPGRSQSAAGANSRRCRHGVERRGQGDRGRILLALPQPRHHGAADLHGVAEARGLPRSVDLDAGRRSLDGRRRGDRRAAAGEGRSAQDDARRRFRPPRRTAGFRQAGREDCDGDAGHAGENDVVARRGHAARLLPSGEHGADEGRTRCRRQSGRPAHAHRLSVDPQGADAAGAGQRGHRLHGGALLHRHALCSAAPAGRLRHAQRPCAGRLLARTGAAEFLLPRVLHRRTGGRGRQGPGRVPAGDAEAGRQEPSRPRGGGEGGGLGHAAAAGRPSRRRRLRRFRQLRRDGCRGVGRREGHAQGAPHRCRDRLGARREP